MSKIRQSAHPIDQGEPDGDQSKDNAVNGSVDQDIHLSEIRNSNIEIRNKSRIRMSEFPKLISLFLILNLEHSKLFRNSDFVLRIYQKGGGVSPCPLTPDANIFNTVSLTLFSA